MPGTDAPIFRVGLNPYGLAYTVGLQGAGTPRVNPSPITPAEFIRFALEADALCVELHHPWLDTMPAASVSALADEFRARGVTTIISTGLTQQPGETLEGAIVGARALGAPIIRLGLSPVLEGARAAWGSRWDAMRQHARATLGREASRAADAGVIIAIENHQDFGSEELVAMAEAAGPNVGVVLDTGNPFAVGEDPVAFTRRAAARIRHVHLKDYRARFTDDGYRLVRCPIGDGSVPLDEMMTVLRSHHVSLTASLEPGALEARHIRLFAPDWWHGYGSREASELGTALGRLRARRWADDASWQTPWERHAEPTEIVAFESAQMTRSIDNMRARGWLSAARGVRSN
jgi:sugar phosphate isomerase/epimerase